MPTDAALRAEESLIHVLWINAGLSCDGDSVALTAAGQRLLERSQQILGEVDRLKENLQIEAHVPSGPVSLVAPPSIGRLVFDQLAQTFLKTFPKVQLSLIEGFTSNVLAQLRRGELSLAVVTDPAPDPLLEYTHLFTESIYLVGRPDDPWLKKRSLEVKSLADLPLVMTSKSNRSRQLIESSAAREGSRLDIRLELESPETLQQLLLSGRIYGLLPFSSIYHGAQTRRLGAVPIRGLAMRRYLAKSRNEVTSIARETLEKTNRVAIARVVIRTKEYIAAVKPIDGALVLELMHWASEIIAPSTLEIPAREKLPEQEMKMARMLVDTMSVDEFEPEKFTNKYHDEMLTMIEARAAGKELPAPKKAPVRAKVVNLMDVLAQSLEESKKRRAGANGKATAAKRRKKTAA